MSQSSTRATWSDQVKEACRSAPTTRGVFRISADRPRWVAPGSRLAHFGNGPRHGFAISSRPSASRSWLRGTELAHDAGRIPAGLGPNATPMAENLIETHTKGNRPMMDQ